MNKPTWTVGRFRRLEPRSMREPESKLPARRHRGALHRHRRFDKIEINPRRDQAAIKKLRADMTTAFVAGDLDTYWRLDRQLRAALVQERV
jgi:hypothetical protein